MKQKPHCTLVLMSVLYLKVPPGYTWLTYIQDVPWSRILLLLPWTPPKHTALDQRGGTAGSRSSLPFLLRREESCSLWTGSTGSCTVGHFCLSQSHPHPLFWCLSEMCDDDVTRGLWVLHVKAKRHCLLVFFRFAEPSWGGRCWNKRSCTCWHPLGKRFSALLNTKVEDPLQWKLVFVVCGIFFMIRNIYKDAQDVHLRFPCLSRRLA